MITYLNKFYQNKSTTPTKLELSNGMEVDVYRCYCQSGGRRHNLLYIVESGTLSPEFPKITNIASWIENKVTKRILAGRNEAIAERAVDVLPESNSAKKRKNPPTSDENVAAQPVAQVRPVQQQDEAFTVGLSIYWDSGEARRLFAPKHKYGSNCDVKTVIMKRIELLENVNQKPSYWRSVVEGGDPENTCTAHDIFLIRHRSLYLACALRKFVEEVARKSRWTWKLSIQHAIATMNDMGLETYSNWETLRRWHHRLVMSRQDGFMMAPAKKTRLPPFFLDNPDAMDAFKKFGVANLKDLSVEKMHEYLHEVLVPNMIKKLRSDDEDQSISPERLEEFLKSYQLTSLSLSTVLRWMHAVGFKYMNRQKHYYVDGHERPETLKYRPIYTKRYLEHEVNAHRWMQFTVESSNLLKAQGSINTELSGYSYTDSNGVAMVEYHIDHCEKIPNLQLPPLGGNLSVRKPPDQPPIILIGQDEAIFKQFLFLAKMWTGPDGERPLLPKDEGAGVMISSFICREHGLLREIDDQTLNLVNTSRIGQSYADEEAAIEVYGDARKRPLEKKKSPFLVYFDYGENRQGYWNYNHMALQFEDTTDVLKVIYPNYKFVYLFDHSSGHSKQRPDGLNASRMNKGFGGKHVPMRSTVIEAEEGFLGQFQRQLQVGDTQHLVFQSTDIGPFWMSEEERESTRHDVIEDGNPISTPKIRAELLVELQSKGINVKGKNKKELVALAEQNGIATMRQDQKVTEGWEGKAKGLSQILWERGLIDGSKHSSYTLDGKKDANGIVDLNTSLRHLMGVCSDFVNEKGMMEFVGAKLGVEVILTPKCHAELAGEGVEYMWACAKGFYRNLSLKEKTGMGKFNESVRKCLSHEVLSLTRLRKFSRRAHQYLMAYHFFDSKQSDPDIPLAACDKLGPVAVEKLVAKFKTHRCAMDFDFKFVMSA
jgi:hypothetical protein